jgi:hypothetical protein
MKKILLSVLMGLMGLSGLRAQQCDTIDAFPWMANFSGGLGCWESTGNGSWTVSSAQTIICYLNSSVTTTGYMTITTPHLRLDCDSSGLRLWWKDKRNYMYPNLKVMVLKEDGMRDTLYTADMGTSLTQHSVSLATYVGQTVRITFEVRLPSGGYDYRGALSDIGIYSQYLPLGTLSVPGMAVVGDSVQAVLSLSQGLSPISYSWHSAMLGDLVAADTLRMVYPSSGWDTLTVTASNAYGTLSRSAKLRVHECPTVATFPWREDFDGYDTASYNVCWTINGWTHRNPGTSIPCYDEDGMYASYSQLMTSSTNGKYMLSPAITIPATGTEHLRLWVQSHNMPTVRISPTASLQPAGFTDTLHVGSSTGNTMVWRLFDLAPYAGQTIRVGLFRQGTSPSVNTIQIDYDTLPVIYADGPAKTATGTSTLLTAHLRHGASEGLHYTWSSQLGGTIAANTLGDSIWITYTGGGDDTLTIVATNAFGSDTVRWPLRVVDCTPATVLPWSENFDDGLACWYRPQGSKFENSLYTSINQVHDSILLVPLRYDTLGSWIMSKEIHLPADTALLPRLFWTVGCSRDNYQTFYSLLVTDSYNWTDTTNYTHLITDSTVHTRSLYGADLMSLDLRPYAGRTIHLAIHNHAGHLSTYITYLNFHSFEIRSTALPWVTLESDATECFFGDTAHFTATFVEGDTNGLTYTWHSSLHDTAITVNSNLLTLTYTQAGLDTVSVVATNAFGSDTATVVVTSTIINEPTVSLVAEGRQYNKVETDDTVVYLATRNRCVTTGMTYQFHSSLMDTTVTVATTADTVRLPMVYPVAGIDTFTVTLSNIHGTSQPAGLTMEVLDCPAVSVPFFEDFESMTMNTSPDCWYGYNWYVSSHNGSRAAYAYNTPNMHFLISPAIDLPDSLGLQLSWSFWYNVFQCDPVMILVSPTGGKRPEDFTDTLYNGRNVPSGDNHRDSLSLDAYRGSRVRVGFPIYGYANYYDDIRIDYDRTAPQVSLNMPGTITLHDTVLFTATINECSPHGLSVSWHSTLMGTSLTPIPSSSGVGSEVQLVYAVTGVDTITVIVANAYGADTAVAVVRVIDCSPFAVPYSEDFEGVTATHESVQGTLADCWDYTWNGSNAAYAPHVITNDGYQYLSNLPSQAILMVAGNATGYGNQAEVLLPRFADSLQTLSIAFDYRKESANIGTLTVGYYDGDTFTALQTMTPQSQTYRRDTVSFASAIVPDGRIALRWTQASSWFAVAIDNVDVFHTPASFFVPQIAIAAPASVLLTDSATYSVTLNDGCSPEGLSFTWHSTLLDSTIVTTESILTLGYTAGGIDTVTVIASNAYGADTAVAVVQVIDCSGAAVPYFEDFEGVTAEGWNSAYGNLPECWGNIAIGASHRPKVVDSYQYISNLPNQALLIMAGTYSGYADAAYVLLPVFSDSLQRLSVAFDYRCESASYGTLTVGYWNDSLLTFHPVRNLASHTGLLYARDTVSFADVASVPHPTHTHIALKWYCNTSYYGVAVDNLEVFINNGILAPDMLTVENVTATCATLRWSEVDTATAYRVTIRGAMSIDTVVTDTTLTLCNLEDDADYNVMVVPMVGSDAGRSVSTTFHTLMLCAPLANVSISPEGIISWQYDTAVAEQSPAGVEIEVIDHEGQVLVLTDTAYFSPYVPASLTPGHTYSFAVRTLCASATANTADTVVMQVAPSVCAEAASNAIPSNSRFMDNFWESNYSQVIYPASFAAGIDTLYGIALRVAQYDPYSWQTTSGTCRYDIYVGQTNGTHTSPLTSDSLTMVVQDKHYSLTGTGWHNFVFTTPYIYDGTSDLVVTIVSRQSNTVYNPVYGVHTDATCTHFVQDEDHTSGQINPSTFNFNWEVNTNIPDIRLLGGCGGSTNTCLAPEVEVASVDTHSVSLQWAQRGSENLWRVEYRVNTNAWQLADTTSATSFTITGLAQATHYLVRVGAVCSDSLIAYGFPDSATTLCGYMELPYTISFLADEYPCWTLGSNLYHNNWNGVTLSEWNTNGFLISPEVNANIADLRATITSIRPVAESYESRFAVGVGNADGSNVTWIDTIGFLQQYTMQTDEVHFNHYTGSGHYIILKGVEGTCNIHQFTLEAFAGCVPVHDVTVDNIGEHSAQLTWVPEVTTNTWAVYLDDALVATTATPSYTLSGLNSNTQYTVAVREICGAGDTSTAVTRLFQTRCDAFALPYFEEFDQAPAIGNDHILTDCWIFHKDGRYASAYCIGDQWSYTCLSFDDDAYSDTLAVNYVCSPRLQVGYGGATVRFKGQTTFDGIFTVGIMPDPYDTTTFIPVRDITVSSGGMAWYSFSTDTVAGAPTSGTFTVAFRFNGEHGSGIIDSLFVEDIPVTTYDLAIGVNDTTMGSVSGAGTYVEGTTVTVTATPNPGYRFVVWSDSVTSATRQITLRNSDISLTAYFEPVPQYTVTVNAVMDNGSQQDGLDEMVHGAGTYMDGDTVTLEGEVHGCATSFVYWITTEGDTLFDNPYTFIIHSDVTLTAVFAIFGGIDDVEGTTFTLHPNPAHDEVTVSVSQPSTLTVLDMAGRVVIPATPITSELRIPTSDLPAGVYFVRFHGNGAVRKLVVR